MPTKSDTYEDAKYEHQRRINSDEKEVRQQCDTLEEVDAALALADDTGLVSKSRQSYFEASITLAAEVRRLRVLNHEANVSITDYAGVERKLLAENKLLREERDLFRTASEAAELRIVELREELDSADRRPDVVFSRGYREGRKEALAEFHGKHIDVNEDLRARLARVEALPSKWRKDAEIYSACGGDADELEAALRDDQTITPPSKAEPYNGY